MCSESYETTLQRLEIVRRDFILPSLINPSKEFDEMTKYAVSGLQCFNPFDFYQPTMFLINRLIGVSGYEYLNNERLSQEWPFVSFHSLADVTCNSPKMSSIF